MNSAICFHGKEVTCDLVSPDHADAMGFIYRESEIKSPKREVFVNVYELSTHYGGPEEGGWEYQSGSPVLSKATTCICDNSQHGELCPAGHWLKALRSSYSGQETWADSFTQAPDGTSWLDSVDDAPEPFAGETMREGKCQVQVESHPGEAWPEQRPHYE